LYRVRNKHPTHALNKNSIMHRELLKIPRKAYVMLCSLKGEKMWITTFMLLFLLGAAQFSQAQHSIIYCYENDTSGTIPYLSNCDVTPSSMTTSNTLVRTFNVTDSFVIANGGEVSLGLNISHNDRREMVVRLMAPNGVTTTLVNENLSNGFANYDVMISDLSETPDIHDKDGDNTGIPYYTRDVQSYGNHAFDSFIGVTTKGEWKLLMSDDQSSMVGTFNRAKLILKDSGALVHPPQSSLATYDWATNGNNNDFYGTVMAGVTMDLTSTNDVFNNGIGSSSSVSNFKTKTGHFGAHYGYYVMGFDVDKQTMQAPDVDQDESGAMIATFDFAPQIYNLYLGFLEIDWKYGSSMNNGGFEDVARILAYDTFGNIMPYETWPEVANTAGIDLVGDLWEGDTTVSSSTADDFANSMYFVPGPIAKLEIEYFAGSDPKQPSNQLLGISDITFQDPVLLPVRYAKFEAKKFDKEVLLDWKTASEKDNDHFEVERAGADYKFTTVGKLDGNGNTNEVISYSYIDETPMSGISYYRLKQVDFNGRVYYSPVRSVDFRNGISKLVVAPNPSSGMVSVSTGQPAKEIAVWSVMGEKVMEYFPTREEGNEHNIDMSHLENGLYYVTIEYLNGLTKQVKLVRE
jgi:subtilisin-like proprotein convertase family protein